MRSGDRTDDFLAECRRVDFSRESVNQEKNLVDLKHLLKTIQEERDVQMKKI